MDIQNHEELEFSDEPNMLTYKDIIGSMEFDNDEERLITEDVITHLFSTVKRAINSGFAAEIPYIGCLYKNYKNIASRIVFRDAASSARQTLTKEFVIKSKAVLEDEIKRKTAGLEAYHAVIHYNRKNIARLYEIIGRKMGYVYGCVYINFLLKCTYVEYDHDFEVHLADLDFEENGKKAFFERLNL